MKPQTAHDQKIAAENFLDDIIRNNVFLHGLDGALAYSRSFLYNPACTDPLVSQTHEEFLRRHTDGQSS
jgi:hypothetical protein